VKTHEEVQAMFEEVVDLENAADQKAVDALAQSVQEAAVEEYGAGIYVRGLLNVDMGGINFKWRRPSCRQRWDYFIPCPVVKPERKAEAGAEKPKKAKAKDNAGKGEGDEPGLFESRLLLLESLLPALSEDDYTADGKPEVKALNALLEGDADFDAEERNNLWAHRSGE
jgi:hypothetical protein